MTVEEIFKLDVADRILKLKNRNTPMPEVGALMREWDPAMHDVMNPAVRKKRRVLVSQAVKDGDDKVIKEARYEEEEVNRIAIPFQQDITNIHTAFAVGIQPDLECDPNDDDEKVVMSILRSIEKDNKIRHVNKKEVRAWLSETEFAEYWYAVEDKSFWKRVKAKAKKAKLPYKGREEAKYKLRCSIFSPFLGDTLYPIFDHADNLIVFSREYKRKEDNVENTYFQTITDKFVQVYRQEGAGWALVEDQSFVHYFEKMPLVYSRRKDGAIWGTVSPIISRVEELLSNFSECIDHHFFPKTIIKGDIGGVIPSDRSQTVQIDGDGDITKLTWQQAPDNVKLEIETHFRQIYSRTQTPDISFDNLKGIGLQSGIAFKYVFMGAHMAVENHAEDIELYLQRRYNFLIHAIGRINTAYEEACQSIEVTPLLVPYMIDDIESNVSIAREAGGNVAIASRRTIVKMAKLVDNVDAEVEAIEKEEAARKSEDLFPIGE